MTNESENQPVMVITTDPIGRVVSSGHLAMGVPTAFESPVCVCVCVCASACVCECVCVCVCACVLALVHMFLKLASEYVGRCTQQKPSFRLMTHLLCLWVRR
jgi:hypothetical protein